LLDKGVDMQKAGNGALFEAADFGLPAPIQHNPEVVRLLVERGANVHTRTEDGTTVLTHVLEESMGSGDPALVRFLLNRGADVNGADVNGHCGICTPLMLASGDAGMFDHGGGSRALVRVLLHYCANVHIGTSLKTALRYGDPEIIRLLRRAGATQKLRGRTVAFSRPVFSTSGADAIPPAPLRP
jgi:ankyrin repeat protein